jgi:hypothetical protein
MYAAGHLPLLSLVTDTNQALFQAKQFSEALEKYTEAIQLAVSFPVYLI